MTELPLILAFVGESGSGKTTIANTLTSYNIFPTIISHTTRPMRDGEIDGIDHIFVDEKDMPEFEKMLAYTFFNGYHYWTSFDDIADTRYPLIYVIDEKGLLDLYKLQEQHKLEVLWIQIERSNNNVDSERKARDKEREQYKNELRQKGYTPFMTVYNNSNVEAACLQLLGKLYENN